MREKSLHFAKVTYLEGSKIISQLHKAAGKLKRNTNVDRVYLFGSFVRGDYVPGSDADISIILKHDDRRIIDRIPEYLDYFAEVEVPVDIFPYTIAEIEKMVASNNAMWREISRTGVLL